MLVNEAVINPFPRCPLKYASSRGLIDGSAVSNIKSTRELNAGWVIS